ncbi:HdeD family acid-resistance protein [candidate division WOR-3 bacterium]|uniref:HdeD family acid-resistance protein n=1 Tax=candidate division WOR-3 bacterium TaxID=2052148 RepID=A0A9D5KBH7_UNCW3|nr:HdeD family acid-resistance protein [candidate division WOR-3 bacterium]MBD3365110.1 HdeD family acid-resistance protein [candidate division WOR-3 bacterium]
MVFGRGIVTPRAWWALLIRGILAIAFGVLALVWPRPALFALLILFGILLVVNGVTVLIRAFSNIKTYPRWWLLLIRGVVEVCIAVLIFIWPRSGLTAFLYLIAAWAIVVGVFDILDVITLWKRLRGKALLIVGGVLSLGFGTLIFLLPRTGALALILIIGLYAILSGILTVIFSVMLRKRNKRLEASIEGV